MWRYVLKRLLWMIPVLLGVTWLIFTMLYFVPGDPAYTILGPTATEEDLAAMRETLGLNDGYFSRLFRYVGDLILRFDFGKSYVGGTSVTEQIIARLPRTVILCFGSMIIAVVIGIPLGVNAAVHQGRLWDSISMLIALAGVSMPPFWVGLLLVLVFSLRLNWLPSVGYATVACFILPWISNSFQGLAMQARQTRSAMLEVLNSDYITTARAKGLSKSKVIFGHALPNALIPVITVAGTSLGNMLGGTVVIESLFAIPGVGSYMITGVNGRDYPVVMASVIILALLFAIIMLLVDLLYTVVDPRIKAQYSAKKKVRG
jgi:peptide/nickel transport system permease protein